MGQSLTKEVKAGDAEEGEFINSGTGEGIGTAIGFIVAYYQQGRFAATRDGKSYVAFESTIPDKWEPLVGEEWVGKPFDEYPDAEERFKAAVNAKEREWGNGPVVSTTHNFTGLVIVEGVEAGDEPLYVEGRLSLKRTDVPAARKFLSLRKMLRLKAFWDTTFDLTTAVKTSGRHDSYIVQVKQGRPTTDEEKAMAVALATEVAAGRTRDNSESQADADNAAAAETPEGALSV